MWKLKRVLVRMHVYVRSHVMSVMENQTVCVSTQEHVQAHDIKVKHVLEVLWEAHDLVQSGTRSRTTLEARSWKDMYK